MIKTTILNYNTGTYDRIAVFRQYEAENGNSVYTVGDNMVTKDEGNERFKELIKASVSHTVTKNIQDADNEEIIDRIEQGYDPYVEYIDNYSQYRSACAHNDYITSLCNTFRQAAGIC